MWQEHPLRDFYDVVIIGGGVHGLATDHFLARDHGIKRVAVLERRCIGSVVVDGGVVRGRVCTCRFSPTLKASIGMALVDPSLASPGGILEIYRDGRLVRGKIPEKKTMSAEVLPMPFYDPKGERLRG